MRRLRALDEHYDRRGRDAARRPDADCTCVPRPTGSIVRPPHCHSCHHRGVLPDDFFEDRIDVTGAVYSRRLDIEMLRALRAGPHATVPDAEVGVALARL